MLYNYPQILYNYPLYIYHEKIGGLISDHGLITFWLSTTRPWQCRRRQCGILCSNCHGRGSHMAEAVLGKMLGMESWIEFWECWLFFTTFSHTHFDFFSLLPQQTWGFSICFWSVSFHGAFSWYTEAMRYYGNGQCLCCCFQHGHRGVLVKSWI